MHDAQSASHLGRRRSIDVQVLMYGIRVLDHIGVPGLLNEIPDLAAKDLDAVLPDINDRALFSRKAQDLFQHVLTSYEGNGKSVYSKSVSEVGSESLRSGVARRRFNLGNFGPGPYSTAMPRSCVDVLISMSRSRRSLSTSRAR